MKSFGRLLGLVLLGLFLLVVALGFALTHLFDPNDYKDEIRQLAREKANLELTLNGQIGWSLFPWLGIELHDATLASANTPQQPFADLQMLGLSVRLLPLLRKEVQMSDIRVDGLNLTLQRDQQGRGNWEDIGRPAKTASPASDPTSSTPATADNSETNETNARQPLQLDIDSLSINNARIDYADARNGAHYTLENLQLKTTAIRESSSIPFKLSTNLSSSKPLLRARTELKASLRFDRALKRYQLEDAELSGEVSGEPLKGKTLTFASQGQLLLDQAAGVAEWNSFKLSANQLRAIGEIKLYDLDTKAKLNGGISIAKLNLREFLDGLGVTLPASADPTSLNSVELVSRLSGSPSSLTLEDLKLKLDDSNISGTLGVADFSRQALRAQLKIDQIDLDRYLPPTSKDSSPRDVEVKNTLTSAGKQGSTTLPSAPTQHAWSDAPLLPIERLRQLDLQAGLSFAQLTLKKLPMENASVQLTSKEGLLEVRDLRGELLGGSFAGQTQIDVQAPVPNLSGKLNLTNLPIEQLLQATGKKPPINGQLDLDSQLQSSGNSEKALIDALNGTASFQLSDGVLLDANLEQQLCTGIATLNRKTLSSPPRGKDTPFQQLDGSISIRNGVASNPDLKVRIPGLAVAGNGDVDLRVLGLDYRLGITIEGDKSTMPDPACQVSKQFVGIEWPLLCRGPLELGAKACRLDQAGLNKVAGKIVGEKLSDKIDEKLGDKVSPELKDALKGLFNR